MPRRPKTGDTLIFALELLRRIPKGRRVTAKELHRQLRDMGVERDKRTVERQLLELCEYFDIERDDRDRPYGYRWKEQSKTLSIPTLNAQESLLLALAEQYLRNLLPANLVSSMQGFFEQAKINLGPHTKPSRDKEWLTKVRVVVATQPLLPAHVDSDVFAQTSAALYHNQWLHVDYENADGKRAEYDVMPLGLAQQGPGLYLVCRFRGHDNERSLSLHRVKSARASTIAFTRPPEFDLEKYDADGRFGFGEGERVRLTFVIDKVAGRHLLETRLSEDQQVEERPDGYKITATVVDSGRLQWWLRGFGDGVRDVRRDRIKPA